jgi:hypothetical protein
MSFLEKFRNTTGWQRIWDKASRLWVVRLFLDRKSWVRQVLVSAISASVAWALGDLAYHGGGLVAAIVSVLSIRISLYKSIREGLGQILGTVVGAGIATIAIEVFHNGLVTVFITVILCAVIARGIHLGEVAAINVPVTALIVLGPGLSESTAIHRVLSTLIGALAAIFFSYFSHGKTPAGRTVDRVTALGEKAAQLLSTMSEGVASGYTQEDAGKWLGAARFLVEEIPAVRSQAIEARRYAKWFPTAEQDEAEELYTRGVAVEHTVVQIRTIARTLFDSAVDGGIPERTLRQMAEALSAASYAISVKVEEMRHEDDGHVNLQSTEDVRHAGNELAEALIEEGNAENHDQFVRSISIVTNIERIADSLDESAPALTEVALPDEPNSQKVLKVNPVEQTLHWRDRITAGFKKLLKKYF